MVTGIAASLGLPLIMPHIIPHLQPFVESHFGNDAANVMVLLGHPITSFPLILGLSIVGCLLATFLTSPEEEEVLKDFYRRVRPWGFWGPVLAKVVKEDPGFKRNPDFFRDMFNIVVGTIWQTCFIVLAMFLVTRRFRNVAITLVVLTITCFILKKTWYDRLPAPTPDPDPVPDLQGQPETGASTAAR
jgi:mannose/fructose/N-acetylgalactosamine-specific phosphotransferase system component IID